MKKEIIDNFDISDQENPASGKIKLQFSLPLVNGESITMVDYGSLDNWDNNMHICTWLPIEHVAQ